MQIALLEPAQCHSEHKDLYKRDGHIGHVKGSKPHITAAWSGQARPVVATMAQVESGMNCFSICHLGCLCGGRHAYVALWVGSVLPVTVVRFDDLLSGFAVVTPTVVACLGLFALGLASFVLL